jgi:NADH-quinone oxidoreductase subunit C
LSEILKALKKKFPKAVREERVQRKRRMWATIKADSLIEVCKYLKDEQDLDHLSSVVGVDYEERFEVVYHLWSYSKRMLISLKVSLPREEPKIPTVTGVWRGANWHERETAELFGITFEGHPYPKRLLLADDFDGYPFRKDYELIENPWYDNKGLTEKKESRGGAKK